MFLSVSHSLYLLLSSPLSHFQPIYMLFVAISSVLRWCYTGRFLAQHITTLFQWHRFERLYSNIWTQCCAKNRRCESFRVTSPLCRCFKTCILSNRALNIHLFMLTSFSDFMCILIHIISPFASVVGEIVVSFAIATLREEKMNKTFHFLYCMSYSYEQHNRHNSGRAVMSIGLNSLKLVWLVQNQFVSSLLMGSFYSIFNFSQLQLLLLF